MAAGPVGPELEVPADVAAEADAAAADAEPAHGTTVGGYAELHLNVERVTGPGDSEATMDMHRFVFFLGHRFTPKLRFYSEVEIEHAVASSEDVGEVEMEQAYVEYALLDDALALRAGLVLIPMGLLNEAHEPPTFHGVERPNVDRVIIPTTWREGGVGIVGTPFEGFRYQLYLTTALSAAGFSASEGVRDGHTEAAEAPSDGFALSARAEYEPSLGVVVGLSGYYGATGANADFFDSAGNEVDISVPVAGVSLDARAKLSGFELRGELAYFSIGDTAELRKAADDTGAPLGLDVGSALLGAYAEVAYDVLYTLGAGDHQLLPFVRLERFDTTLSLAGRKRTAADDKNAVTEVAMGLTYRPIPQVAFKGDFILANPDGAGSDTSGRFNLGVGVMY